MPHCEIRKYGCHILKINFADFYNSSPTLEFPAWMHSLNQPPNKQMRRTVSCPYLASSGLSFVSNNLENMIFCLIIFLGVQGILRHLCVDAARAGREPGSPRSTSVNDLKVNARINKFCTRCCRRKTKTLNLTFLGQNVLLICDVIRYK